MDVPLMFERGQSCMYGAGLDWIGILVGLCAKNIFEPLNMKSTTTHLEEHDDVRRRVVTMCTRDEKGGLVDGGFTLADPAQDDLGGSGLYSSASDYLRLLQDSIKEKPTLLSIPSAEEMFKPQLSEGGLPMAVMKMLGSRLWGFYMSDAEPEMNHGLDDVRHTKGSSEMVRLYRTFVGYEQETGCCVVVCRPHCTIWRSTCGSKTSHV